LPPIPQPAESGTTQGTDVPLYWVRYGERGAGIPMLLLHGGPGASHDYLLPQMLQLADRRPLYLYDQRGGGRSRAGVVNPPTWRTHVADTAQVIRELQLDTFDLLGYSWGALLAMLFAIESSRGTVSARPRRLVLMNPAPIGRLFRAGFEAEFARRQASPEVSALRDELLSSGLRERDPDVFKQRSFELSVAGYFADPARAHDLTPFRVIARSQQSVWESLGDYDLGDQLAEIDLPALVIHGREDPIPLESSEAAASALRAHLVILENCGHVPYVECPEPLWKALEEFLG
jgi:proline iminopeptidase